MPSKSEFIRTLYSAFNAREIETVLASLCPDVDWPNGMEGGREHGRDAVRAYWQRQWSIIDPRVDPVRIAEDKAGKILVAVHQVIRDLAGKVTSDRMVRHVYTFRDGLIARMDIETAADVEHEKLGHTAQSDVTAFVLAGGKSERMGEDKATMRLPSGRTLLENALAIAGAVAGQVGIVGSRHRYASYAWAGEIVDDIVPDRGPLGGIHAALTASTTEWNVILAVDVPGVTAALLEWILKMASEAGAQVTLVSVGGGLQPLCGVYRKNFRERAERALKDGHNKVDASFDRNSLRILSEAEILAAGFSPEMFTNVNTPEEFQRLAAGK
ncbi:MAG TPA: NTP transferase domain-containing protein [Terriglobales bacterium]|nr:NTP transferase domain-containing protein [Terriglobales bacterium]